LPGSALHKLPLTRQASEGFESRSSKFGAGISATAPGVAFLWWHSPSCLCSHRA